MLSSHGIEPTRIDVFVADQAEYDTYKAVLSPGTFSNIIIGVLGMGAIRNFIQRHYPEGTPLFCIDDDIKELYHRVDDKVKEPVRDLHGLIIGAFEKCLETGYWLWGIYPVLNPFFMSDTISTDLRYIIGCCWGCINRHGEKFSVTLDDKEDFERTIKYYIADGGVLRLSNIAPATNYYNEPGGMQIERTEDRIEESAKLLVKRYPFLCSLNTGKKSGHVEVRLKDNTPKGARFF
jgi:hypothetical protein